MTTYHAKVERGERLWLVHVPAVDRWTQARRLSEVDEMARDLIAIMEDVDPDSIELRVEVQLPDDVEDHLARANELRELAAHAQSEAAAEARLAARSLADRGMPLREIGRALHVSYQRAHQLVSQADAPVDPEPPQARERRRNEEIRQWARKRARELPRRTPNYV